MGQLLCIGRTTTAMGDDEKGSDQHLLPTSDHHHHVPYANVNNKKTQTTKNAVKRKKIHWKDLVQQLRNEKEQLSVQLKEKSHECDELVQEVTILKHDNLELQKRMQELINDHLETEHVLQRDYEMLMQANAFSLEEDVMHLRKEMRQLNREHQRDQSTIRNYQLQIDTLKSNLMEYKERNESLEKSLKACRQDLRDMRSAAINAAAESRKMHQEDDDASSLNSLTPSTPHEEEEEEEQQQQQDKEEFVKEEEEKEEKEEDGHIHSDLPNETLNSTSVGSSAP